MEEDRTRVLGAPMVVRAARWGLVAWATIGVLVLGYILFRFVLYPIRIVFPPLVVALVLVYLLNPLVSWAERRGVGRLWGTLALYLVFGGIVGGIGYFVFPLIADQATAFVQAAPAVIERLTDSFANVAQRFGVGGDVSPAAPSPETISEFLGRLVSFTQGLVGLVIVFVVGPILAFYFLVDLPKVKRGLQALIPARRRAEVQDVLRKMGEAVGRFFRGQLLVALFVGVASAIGLYIVGLPFWALVGMVAGLFNLIPLIGPFIGGGVALIVAFTTQTPGEGLMALRPGWPLAVGSAVALLIVQQLDNHILSPNIVGRTVRLHPVTVMLGLMAGGTLLGLWGMLLAVPTLASAKILVLHAWDTRMTWPPREEAPATEEDQERAPPPAPSPAAPPRG